MNAWFFGDSFTAGYGATPDTEYFREFGPGDTFSTLLSKHLGCKEINLGTPGCCNTTIINKVLNELPSIHIGDVVVIGNTSPLRDLIPSKDGSKLIDQKLFHSDAYQESIAYGNKKLQSVLTDYCINFKSNHIELWNSHYTSTYLKLLKYFNSKGVRAILWDYEVWSEEITAGMKFENIKEHTKDLIYDLHWSYNGHRDAYEWIKKGLEEGKKILK